MKLSASHHALQRARERVHWTAETVERMLLRVYYTGIEPQDCPRGLREFLASLVAEEAGNAARIYGEFIYIFGGNLVGDEMMLITLYPLPLPFRRLSRKVTVRWWQRQRDEARNHALARTLLPHLIPDASARRAVA